MRPVLVTRFFESRFKRQRLPFRVLIWFFAFVASMSFGQAICSAHELKDGEVVRAAELIVRDNRLFLKYTIGANDVTLGDILTKAGEEKVPTETAELTELFEKKLAEKVLASIRLSFADKKIVHETHRVRQTDKHHQRIVIEAEYVLPGGGGFEIFRAEDTNFSKRGGSVRFAMRPRGKTLMLNCNVAPVLARAKPTELADLDQDKRQAALIIKAKLKVPKAN